MKYARIKELITSALKANPEATDTFADVQAALERGRAQYWEIGETVAITRIKGVALHIWLLAGDLSGADHLQKQACIYARQRGLEGLVIQNWRKGWKRYLSKFGFRELNGWLIKEV